MKNKIFVALSTFSEYGDEPLNILNKSGIDYHVNPLERRLIKQEIMKMGRDATGIIAGVEPYDAEVLLELPKLKCISRVGVGIDNIDLGYTHNNNITIKNTPHVVVRPVAELTLAMIFDLLRKTTFHTILLKQNRWKKSAGNLLLNKTVGIVGTGRIGKTVAELLIALGANLIAYDVTPDIKWSKNIDIEYISFENLLSLSDIISLHAAPMKDQLPLIGSKEIASMKKGVILINTSRGDSIDEAALCDGLASGKVSAVGMDVFLEEPYKGKLIDFDNVVLTPHLATLTKESRLEMEIQATQNLLIEINRNKE